ncbi:MAG: DUF418 domain-containing protein [Prevotella sp.]|nr:DUF418 domain-containing protein [Prevotella sp.]
MQDNDTLYTKTDFANDKEAKRPTTERQRHLILDILRGFALMGIALANYPEFALWTFLSSEQQATMPTAETDKIVRFLQYLLVDGKFYTIFSLLFGVGFSLILNRHGISLFLRRMIVLVCIGFVHLMFIWSGDILLLYAIGGLLLTLFVRFSNKSLLCIATLLIFVPVVLDGFTEFYGTDFAAPLYDAWWRTASSKGITEDNFAIWLRDANTYPQMFAFLVQGAVERMWEFVEGHRLPKVLGLFIVGYVIGKNKLYTRIFELPLCTLFFLSFIVGAPTSFLYACSAVGSHPWGGTIHSLLYAVSVIPLAFTYIFFICLLFTHNTLHGFFRMLAAPGRMALSNYIGQSLIGIFLFYGIGLGFGTSFGLIHIVLVAFAVFIFQTFASRLWLSHFRFGVLEWLWRMLTYGRYFPIKKEKTET